MDWPSIAIGALGTPALGGIAFGVRAWLQARAKRVEAEAKAIETKATSDAKATDAEVTAKVKLIEAQAEAVESEAKMDAATAEAINGLREDIQACKEEKARVDAALESERAWCRNELGKANARIDVLYERAGLTPRDMPKQGS